MNTTQKPARAEPGTATEDSGKVPNPGAGQGPAPAQRPERKTPDKEGGAPVDEMDLDGDGSGRQ